MSRYYQIDEWLFFPQKNEVHHAGNITKVRPKSAELLTVLLEAKGEIVSKADLLNLVWNDVVVEEHVVFQSIAELRKIFEGIALIKTHPRKGYSISIPIVEHQQQVTDIKTLTPDTDQHSTAKAGHLRAYLAVFMLLLALSATMFFILKEERKALTQHDSVLILPVKNRIVGSEHYWVRYGGMDLLIKYLQPHLSAPVQPAEMVLDIIKRADINLDSLDEVAIARLFEVSGAELIVTQAISGFSGDYQLVYGIYDKNNVHRGAIFADDITQLFADLNTLLLESLGIKEKTNTEQYQHSFANALMAAAIDEVQSENYQQAVTMFQAVLINEPRNLLAVKMLVKSLTFIGRYQEAVSVAEQAIELAQQNPDQKQLGRLMFWQAVSITQQQKYDQALTVLAKAKEKSEQTNDVLYLANISRVKGKLYLKQEKYTEAEQEIYRALSLYQAVKEPYGQSNMYLDLGELELSQSNTEAAKQAFQSALTLANKSRLTELINQANQWLAQATTPK